MADDLDLLTIREAAELLRVKEDTLRGWIRLGKLPAYRASRRVLLRRADVEAMVVPWLPGQGHVGGSGTGGEP